MGDGVWASATAFNGGDEGSFFAADKGSRAEADFNVEVEGSAADAAAEKAATTRLAQSGGETGYGYRIFGADVDKPLLAPTA